ncbi:uncharacterized protein LOC127862793 isoform X2 [Dreissena polymorpha]|uniref:TRAF-type domain-containing protein n=3 Tax=Dreissena polymorpha TaxID=45954 RepID=A0A9D3YD77_DREPO|nr:uncharacterized protein LOC127862793 isoform X2 [Dreissena polymorpha]XP_052258023.1 uncharacterized protein LOC127862793 isoform X2 [Dreissena polymorpha]XP_052258024.1 uncharacterized protein LOC127862793 isoform X2 [Dreissena polymorpha]KAH3698210.1 hypothetical protein DPMN_085729 [Dreissena polymorpha]
MSGRCSNCGRKMQVSEDRNHEEICRNIVQCKNCGQLVDSTMTRTHDTFLCPESNIWLLKCEWSPMTPFIEPRHDLLNASVSDQNHVAIRNLSESHSLINTQRTGDDHDKNTTNTTSSENCISKKLAETEALLFKPNHFNLSAASPECRTSHLESPPTCEPSTIDPVSSISICSVSSGLATPARRRLFNELGSSGDESVGDFQPVCRLSSFYEK